MLSVGVLIVHWLVNGCKCTWALMTVMGASGMGVVQCRLSSMVVLVGVKFKTLQTFVVEKCGHYKFL